MNIIIRFDNEILGGGIFWEGKPENINQIRNLAARIAAKKLIATGNTAREGMWIAEKAELAYQKVGVEEC